MANLLRGFAEGLCVSQKTSAVLRNRLANRPSSPRFRRSGCPTAHRRRDFAEAFCISFNTSAVFANALIGDRSTRRNCGRSLRSLQHVRGFAEAIVVSSNSPAFFRKPSARSSTLPRFRGRLGEGVLRLRDSANVFGRCLFLIPKGAFVPSEPDPLRETVALRSAGSSE